MEKQTMIKEMEKKVTEVMEARDAVYSFLDEIEEAVSAGQEQVTQIEEQIASKQEALTLFTDFGEVKLAKQEIDSLEEDMELLKQVYVNKVNAMYGQLENIAEEMFKAHKSAVFLYRTVDNYILLNTNLSELKTNMELMGGFGQSLNGAFASVRAILLDTGIVANADQNRNYRGIHLGARGLDSELINFEYEVRPYVNRLRSAGAFN
ncbi:hypothetical protein ACNRWW_13900 [Metabacillus sp. HB246100]